MNKADVQTFKNIVSRLLRLTIAATKGDTEKIKTEFDMILDVTIQLIENGANLSKEAESNLTDAFLSKESDAVLPSEPVVPTPPTLHIYPSNVIVEKIPEGSDKEVHLVYTSAPSNVVIHQDSDSLGESQLAEEEEEENKTAVDSTFEVEKKEEEARQRQ